MIESRGVGSAACAAAGVEIEPNAISAEASSELPASRSATYRASNTVDGELHTAWSEGVRGTGLGQTLTYRFARSVRVGRIDVANGYWKGTRILQNARLAVAELTTDAGTFTLRFAEEPQELDVFCGDFGTTRRAILRVLSVHPGSKWEDLVISEVGFWALGSVTNAATRDIPKDLLETVMIHPLGAGPLGACAPEGTEPAMYLGGAMRVTSTGDDTGERERPAELQIDWRGELEVCVFGFDTSQPLELEVTFPNGRVERRRATSDPFYLGPPSRAFLEYWEVLPHHPTGRYRLSVRQGSRRLRQSFTVLPLATPFVTVLPIDRMTGYGVVRGEKSDTFRVALAGFRSKERVSFKLYALTPWDYLRRRDLPAHFDGIPTRIVRLLEISVDERGNAVHPLRLLPSDPTATYCLVLEAPRRAPVSGQTQCGRTTFAAGWFPPSG